MAYERLLQQGLIRSYRAEPQISLFDQMRRKRHRLVYEMVGLVSHQEAEQALHFPTPHFPTSPDTPEITRIRWFTSTIPLDSTRKTVSQWHSSRSPPPRRGRGRAGTWER